MQLTYSQLENRNVSPETLEWYRKRRAKCSSCLRESFGDWSVYRIKKENLKDHKDALMFCLGCLLDDVVDLSSRASGEPASTSLNLIRRCCACMLNTLDACLQAP